MILSSALSIITILLIRIFQPSSLSRGDNGSEATTSTSATSSGTGSSNSNHVAATTASSNATGTAASSRPSHLERRHASGSAVSGQTGSNEDTLKKYRVVVMGAAKVGKTAIINQFLYDSFTPKYTRTIEEMHHGEYEVR